jgi:nitrate/nitrite transporter NarK
MGLLRHWRLGGFILPILFGTRTDPAGIRLSAFMLPYGVAWVSLFRRHRTEVRGTELVVSPARAFRLKG